MNAAGQEMTAEDARFEMMARWHHAPLAPADVEERVAARLDGAARPVVQTTADDAAVRLFVLTAHPPLARLTWRSAYVHHLGEVDGVFDRLADTMRTR